MVCRAGGDRGGLSRLAQGLSGAGRSLFLQVKGEESPAGAAVVVPVGASKRPQGRGPNVLRPGYAGRTRRVLG